MTQKELESSKLLLISLAAVQNLKMKSQTTESLLLSPIYYLNTRVNQNNN